MAYNGVINVYKEQGFTSFDVVAKLRGILKQKKIGHTGTLDPMAEGVLLVCLGKATKLVDYLILDDKEYEASVLLGKTTDTDDVTGQVLSEACVDVSEDKVLEVIESFVGEYDQLPPMYSAIKIDGKKLYEYAREGKSVERAKRKVEIFSIDEITVSLPIVSFKVHCSKGTYIRSLARDIGEKLGCGATLNSLKRSNIKGFNSEDGLKLSEIEQMRDAGIIEEKIMPVDAFLSDIPVAVCKEEGRSLLMNGNKLQPDLLELADDNFSLAEGNRIRVYMDEEFLALYEYKASEKLFKPVKMFLG